MDATAHAASMAATPAPQATTPALTPATGSTAAPATPAASGALQNPNCPGGSCDLQQSHITIATPAPAPAPWPWQERIQWVAQILLVLIAYIGIWLAISLLRKIERQTLFAEMSAEAAAVSAKAALHFAETQAKAQSQIDRPWILVTAVPAAGIPEGFNIVAANRGRTPARIVTQADEIVIAKDETQLPAEPAYRAEPKPPQAPILLLPGESFILRSFRRDEMKSVCETDEQVRRVEDWVAKIYIYGYISYAALTDPEEEPARETSWCCWYIHGRQKSGMVMAGPPAYNRHT